MSAIGISVISYSKILQISKYTVIQFVNINVQLLYNFSVVSNSSGGWRECVKRVGVLGRVLSPMGSKGQEEVQKLICVNDCLNFDVLERKMCILKKFIIKLGFVRGRINTALSNSVCWVGQLITAYVPLLVLTQYNNKIGTITVHVLRQ